MKTSKPTYEHDSQAALFSVLDVDAALQCLLDLAPDHASIEQVDADTWLFRTVVDTYHEIPTVWFAGLAQRWEGTYTRIDFTPYYQFNPPDFKDLLKQPERKPSRMMVVATWLVVLGAIALMIFLLIQSMVFIGCLVGFAELFAISAMAATRTLPSDKQRIASPARVATFIAPFQAAGIVAYSPEEFTKEIIRAEAFYSVSDEAVFGKTGQHQA